MLFYEQIFCRRKNTSQAVKGFFIGNAAIRIIVKYVGVDFGVLHNWINQYEFFHEGAFLSN